jgi:hypothetical protein
MTAYNIVRMKVKPGEEDAYLDLHRSRALAEMPGLNALRVVKTGEREYFIVGEWTGMDALAAARPAMIATLDEFRDRLEDLGGGLGVTDPASGEVVVERMN